MTARLVRLVVGTGVLLGALMLGASGCAMFTNQATTQSYDPSDGVSATIGGLEIRNALIVSNDGKVGNLVLTALNTTSSPVTVGIAYGTSGVASLGTIPAGASVVYGAPTRTTGQVQLPSLNTQPGSMLPVIFRFDGTSPGRVNIPVLTSSMQEYSTLTPTPSPAITSSPLTTAKPAISPVPTS